MLGKKGCGAEFLSHDEEKKMVGWCILNEWQKGTTCFKELLDKLVSVLMAIDALVMMVCKTENIAYLRKTRKF